MPVIIPTKKCDLRCTHCLRDDYKGGYLDPDLLGRFLMEFKKHSKQRSKHSFTGGEPTVHTDLEGLLRVFRYTEHSLYIVSNGQNEKGVETVIRNKDVIDYMSISLDAPNAEINDITRGEGTFDKVVESTKEYMKNGVDVDFRFVIHDGNAHALEEAFILARSLDIKRLRFSTLHPVAKGEDNDMTVSYSILLDAFKRLPELQKKYPGISAGMNTRHMIPYLQPEWIKDFCTPVGGPLNGLTLMPDGKINFCCDLVDNDFIQERYPDENEWLDPIIGDYNIDSLDVIKERKLERIKLLKKRRRYDVADAKVTGQRGYICENCKFYHYKNKPKVIKVIKRKSIKKS